MMLLPSATNATSFGVGYRLVHNGNTVISDNQVGVCYSTSPNPTIADNKIYDEIPGSRDEYRWRYTWAHDLNPETTYYFRAFVTNSEGTAYSGDAELVVTPAKKTGDDVITFFALQNSITKNSKNLLFGAMGSNSVITEMGVCYSESQNPTIANSKETVPIGNGSKYVTLTNLESNTTYYYRGYFIDADGVSYTKQLSFTTLQNILKPAVGAITTELTPTQVKINANVTSDGGDNCVNYIAYTKIKARLASSIPDSAVIVGNGIGTFNLTLEKTSLSSGTWYCCSYSKNSIGVSQSEIKTFTVEDLITQGLPTLSVSVSSIKDTSVYWNGQVVSTGNSDVLSAKIEIKKTSDNTLVYTKTGLLTPSDYAIANGLEPATSYTIIYSVKTQYIEDNNLADSVITKVFSTVQTPTDTPLGEKPPKISLTAQKKVGNNVTFSQIMQ
jgi:propanediol dehydratase small subunit